MDITNSRERDMEGQDHYFLGIDCKEFKVCAKCGGIYGTWDYRPKGSNLSYLLYQKCSCDNGTPYEEWPCYDFNEIVTLCYCCGREILNSGSKMSIWFCEECKKRVLELNRTHQKRIVPIGRHSVLAGMLLMGSDIDDKQKIQEYVTEWNKLVAKMDILDEFVKIKIPQNIKDAGFVKDPSLANYLASVDRFPDKPNSFNALVEYFRKANAV